MQRIKVWDLPVRLFHLGLAATVLVAFLSGDEDEASTLHTTVGLVVLGLVVFRVVFGLVGPTHARFRDFVRGPREVLQYVRAYARGRPPLHLGHNPLGGLMVVALLGALALTALTGVLIKLGPEWDGALAMYMSRSVAHGIKELHEGAAGALLALIPLHIAGTIVSSLIERQNLPAAMITGFKRAPDSLVEAPVGFGRRALGFVAAAALGLAAALGVWALLPVNTAEAAETPAGLLERYATAARAQDATFSGFDKARGKQLYFAEHERSGKVSACATCHGQDPAQGGRSPAGKRIEALDPAANPSRFTDAAFAEKWFERNCKQVLGRSCTPLEKGDFITWVSAPSR